MLSYLLALMVFGPLAGALALALWGGDPQRVPRAMALATTVAILVCAVVVAAGFDASHAGFQMDEQTNWNWLPQVGIRFHLGLDGISLWLVVLTALLSVTAVLVSWDAERERTREYYALLLALETGMLGVFTALDIVLFYIFFEFTLIPLFFLIGIWGGSERRLAARKFFIYTLAGSVLTLLGLLYIVVVFQQQNSRLTFSIPELIEAVQTAKLRFTEREQWWLFLALMAGFAIKVPLFPFHTWLPLAHVEAPTAGSVILAGVLLKIGTYGFLRFSLSLLPLAAHDFLWLVAVLAVIGIVYGALVSLAQDDIKKLIAYSSVSHLGFCMLGLFALNATGISGGLLQMVNHGLSTGALFALVGMLYSRYHTREIRSLGGLARQMPVLAFFFVLITLSSIGLPGLNGFIGEFLVLVGMFQVEKSYAIVASLGIILGAFYMLWLVQRILFGPLKEPHHDGPAVRDLNRIEIAALAPIAAACLWIGLYPNFFLSRMEPAVRQVAEGVNVPAVATRTAPLPRGDASPFLHAHLKTWQDSQVHRPALADASGSAGPAGSEPEASARVPLAIPDMHLPRGARGVVTTNQKRRRMTGNVSAVTGVYSSSLFIRREHSSEESASD
ncbi:MAG: NADH-quinone oxidoreductase subunit M [Planctomycetes bacterium]|nr:NADH-quinone oxidoreductase subunit M [Planctomycetota bacterium]